MQRRHQTPDLYFREQSYTTRHHVIPFLHDILPVTGNLRVLEIGCGHGGNMEPFLDLGCRVTGIDINPGDISMAQRFYTGHVYKENLTLLATDVYLALPERLGVFDLIVMKDVIEHIHDQAKFMGFIRQFLSKDGRMFLGFPPWQMPFGGHQQVCENRLLAVLPYYHLLPIALYRRILAAGGEKQARIDELLETKTTGLSIERFRRILNDERFDVERERFFLVNPNYEVKFGLRPRQLPGLISLVPYFRNFVTTCCYYVVKPL